MTGAEYLTAPVLAGLWRETDQAFDAELAEAGVAVQDFLKARHPAWNLVGRVYFNLAENRKDAEAPFAFLAVLRAPADGAGEAQHLPLGRALQEYAGAKNRERLLSLLTPVQRASEHVAWLKDMVASGAIYHPLRWSPQQALQFLKDVPALETAGVIVRMPASWRMGRPARPTGHGDSRRQGAGRTRPRRAARLPHRDDARGRDAVGRGGRAAARRRQRACLHPRPMGRDRSRAAEPHARSLRDDRAAGCRRGPFVRRGHAPGGGCGDRRGRDRQPGQRRLERDRRRFMAGRDVDGASPSGQHAERRY